MPSLGGQPARTPEGRAALRLAAMLLALAVVPALGACGKKGDLEPPPGEESEYPRTYPDPQSYPGHGRR